MSKITSVIETFLVTILYNQLKHDGVIFFHSLALVLIGVQLGNSLTKDLLKVFGLKVIENKVYEWGPRNILRDSIIVAKIFWKF